MIQNFIRTYPNLFSIILFALLLQSCKKSDQVASPEKELSSLERKFFFTNRTGDLTECKLVDFLIRQNRSKSFGCANPNLSIGEYLNTNSLHFTNNTINNLSELLSRPSNTIKGIFSAVWDYPTGSTTGHADLLNSISPWCDGRCHLNEKHKYIDIWPLQ